MRIRRPHLRLDQVVYSRCYGTMLATGEMVDLGEAIRIVAASPSVEPEPS